MTFDNAGRDIAEYLNTLPDDEVVAVGSMTAFYFIGTVRRYWHDIKGIEMFYKNKSVRLRQMASERLNTMYSTRAKSSVQEIEMEATRLIQSARRWQETYTDIRHRVIMWQSSRTIREQGCRVHIIKVQGEECGEYWLKWEYESGVGEL